jgi:hypothetical protein
MFKIHVCMSTDHVDIMSALGQCWWLPQPSREAWRRWPSAERAPSTEQKASEKGLPCIRSLICMYTRSPRRERRLLVTEERHTSGLQEKSVNTRPPRCVLLPRGTVGGLLWSQQRFKPNSRALPAPTQPLCPGKPPPMPLQQRSLWTPLSSDTRPSQQALGVDTGGGDEGGPCPAGSVGGMGSGRTAVGLGQRQLFGAATGGGQRPDPCQQQALGATTGGGQRPDSGRRQVLSATTGGGQRPYGGGPWPADSVGCDDRLYSTTARRRALANSMRWVGQQASVHRRTAAGLASGS